MRARIIIFKFLLAQQDNEAEILEAVHSQVWVNYTNQVDHGKSNWQRAHMRPLQHTALFEAQCYKPAFKWRKEYTSE